MGMLFKGFTSRVGTLTLPQKLHRVVFSAPPPHNVSTRNARKEIKQEVRHVVCLRRLTLLSHTQFLSISVANGFPQSIPGIWQISQSLVLAQSSGDILATSIGPLACFELSHVVGRVPFFLILPGSIQVADTYQAVLDNQAKKVHEARCWKCTSRHREMLHLVEGNDESNHGHKTHLNMNSGFPSWILAQNCSLTFKHSSTST